MSPAQPEVRVLDSKNGVYLKRLSEDLERGHINCVVHAPGLPTHEQLMFIHLWEWDKLERVG